MEGLTNGRVVHYVLSEDDAKLINERRKAANQTPVNERIPGIQYYVGNNVEPGKHCPMVITEVWNVDGLVNGKVLLDGQDDYWVTSKYYSDEKKPYTWHWIEKA